jgi:excinuclease UvrABC nuclease subunit
MAATCKWPLGNGQFLNFEVYSQNTGWNALGGLYIFTRLQAGNWQPLYVGQAENFQTRLPSHERLDEAVRNGATHIHATVVRQQGQRDEWERMLIRTLQPPMNAQHR